MNKISVKYFKPIGLLALGLLLLINIGIIFYTEYILVLTTINITTIVFCFYRMTLCIKTYMTKEKIACSILKISNQILSVDSRQALYESVLHEIINNIPDADKGSLMTIDEHGDLTFQAVVGFDIIAAKSLNIRFEDTYLFKAIKNVIPKSVVIDDIGLKNKLLLDKKNLDIMYKMGIDDIKTTVCIPISFDKKIFGLINIDSVYEEAFSHNDINLIETFSNEISKVIRLYQLFEKNTMKSKYDGLTGVLNRTTFTLEVSSIFNELTKEHLSIVCYDLDQLKVINDRYGHDVGDLYLNHFVTGIKNHIYKKEYFSRFGGNEFVLLYLRESRSFNAFKSQCDHWFVENPLIYKGEVLSIQYSFGIANYGSDGQTIKELINMADHKMYPDKK